MNSVILYHGNGRGDLLKLSAPLSFWGGVDPETGVVIAAGHPQRGERVGGQILAMPSTIGSSSSSSVLLELIRNGNAPAGLVLGRCDAILIVACLVGRELGYPCPPVVEMAAPVIECLAAGHYTLDTSRADNPLTPTP